MTLVKFNPEKRSNALLPGFNDIFETIFNDSFLSDTTVTRVPAVNISESAENFHIELAAPGLKKQDFKISVDDNVLNISVEHQTEHTENDRNITKENTATAHSFVHSHCPILPIRAELTLHMKMVY